MEENNWTVVRNRKDRKRKKLPSSRHASLPSRQTALTLRSKLTELDDMDYSEKEHKKMRGRIEAQTKAVDESKWWILTRKQLQDAIQGRKVVALHCLGLGSFTNSKNASYQLACAMLIRRTFAPNARCTIADPKMGITDRVFAAEKGFSIIETVDISERDMKEPAIAEVGAINDGECFFWFMPHCARELYEYVLAKSERFGYDGVVILGNKLSEYTMREREDQQGGILRVLSEEKRFIERDCPNPECSPYLYAFNGLSVMTITRKP